ncbi:L-lactate dehydrogenase complex protein LldE [Alicyclobacillus sacchari]|uniref:L-lactate dehydrogenase complex protein LldE n=1 Tax=Alicyclobacillus sacchari TaxID=392010 RepID=A0A4R8LHB7_9BACL|nr:(Fe-S)-binding protein [Alicyclobacillus sacchari]TDY42584.1 L-lactate dehydrogenase complex protein LldE [Alicyclobacillus sacchari]GMA58124.1 Fe-S oxidoreductase [Alicyclobacillus sacchari]
MKVSLFITCVVDSVFPNVGVSLTRILQECGCDVSFPPQQTCCGQPAFNSGYTDEARDVGMTLLRAFRDSDVVVSPSGSCVGMIHHYYPQLFANDPQLHQAAVDLANKTYEFSQFMVKQLQITDLGARFPHRVTYHPSCHGSRLLGVKDEPMQLLQGVHDIEIVELPYATDCCGFGGTFAVKMGEISGAMVDEKAENVARTDAEVLVGTDMGCLMNIGGRLRRTNRAVRVMHLAELLMEGMQLGKAVNA